ncbi:MAG: D-tyrosyl-tRNA(Tyr) deacylase [Clostridiales bacterium]|nr:D-tyrosyl-tRNA(Tyr) deacylase [Clostridiales bacterium]
MRAVVQRVSRAKVSIDEREVGRIGKGLVIYLGIEHEDTMEDVNYMVNKITNLRIFQDEEDKMNLSVKDVKGELLIISQFTIMGDCRKGRRPSYIMAARPEEAIILYDEFIKQCEKTGIGVESGEFQAHMMVDYINDGPVTILVDSKKIF